MAKKETEGKEFSFNDLNKLMNKNSKWGGLMSEGAGISEITEYIPTGNYLLNACLTGSLFQGIPNNRSICVSGESGVGKTYLLLNMCREAQKKNYYIVYYDSENAIDLQQIKSFGIDPSRFRYEPVGTVQDFRTNITGIVDTLIEQKENGNKIPKIFFALDSVGNLATQKEVDDAVSGSDKVDLTRSKLIRSIFRILMSKLGVIGASFVFSNHVYQSMDLFSTGPIQSGGKGLVYGASIILNMSKAKLKEDGTNQTGIIVTAKPEKNRFCKPMAIKFHISYIHGMNPYVGLESYFSWDRCGIGRGKFITGKEYEKLTSGKEDCRRCETPDEVIYFQPSDTGRNICCDDGKAYPTKDLFSSEIFTEQRLRRLDEFIQSEFKYPSGTQLSEIESIISDDINEEEDPE